MMVEVTNVRGDTTNQWVGRRGEAVRTMAYPGDDDYFVEVKMNGAAAITLLFRLSEINIIPNKEKLHWFITIYPQRVEGRCSDGRTFSQPFGQASTAPMFWMHGFTTALNMSGQTYEIREED